MTHQYVCTRMNASKTKILVFEKNEEKTECKISINGMMLEQVNEVVGSMFRKDGR